MRIDNKELINVIIKLLVSVGSIKEGELYTVRELIQKANEFTKLKLEG